ncbi:MAG: hypothetical protein AAB176_01395 [Pseudomonadota bacterium]|jgi:hypothetical protein
MNRFVCLLWCLASLGASAQAQDALLDYSLVAPPVVEQRKIAQPVVQWLTRPDAPDHCAQIKDHDGFAVWKEGCVYWSLAQSTCTIVTTGNTTHSQVGRLFILCLTSGDPA